jgi:general stress protein 26
VQSDTHAQIIEILDRVTDMTVATVRSDGFPQANVVSFVHDDTKIYFMTVAGSQKALNLLHSDKVSGTVTPPYDSWDQIEGLSFAGHASVVTDAAEHGRVLDLMLQRFPQMRDMEPPEPVETILVRVDPVVFSVLDYTQVFGHAELVEVQTLLA